MSGQRGGYARFRPLSTVRIGLIDLSTTTPSHSVDLDRFRAAAIAATRRAVAELEQHHVEVLVTGSLVDGSFDLHSDVDLLVVRCPRAMKYALEGIVEDAFGRIPFDVIYLDEVEPRKLQSFTDKARHVEELD